MDKVLNPKCEECGMCALVTQTITGYPMPEDEQYHQCLAMIEDECLDGENMNIKE